MGIEDEGGAGRSAGDPEAAAGEAPFVYEAGRTLYMMPFTDAEEEAAWDQAVEYMRRPV